MRRCQFGCAVHQLHCIWYRMPHSDPEAKEDPLKRKGWRQASPTYSITLQPIFLTPQISDQELQAGSQSPITVTDSPADATSRDRTAMYNTIDGTPTASMSEAYAAHQSTHNGTYVQFMKPKFARAPIKKQDELHIWENPRTYLFSFMIDMGRPTLSTTRCPIMSAEPKPELTNLTIWKLKSSIKEERSCFPLGLYAMSSSKRISNGFLLLYQSSIGVDS